MQAGGIALSIINETNIDLVNILLGCRKFQKYSIFHLVLFLTLKLSPVNYFGGSTMAIAQIYELSFISTFWLSFLPCLVVDTVKA